MQFNQYFHITRRDIAVHSFGPDRWPWTKLIFEGCLRAAFCITAAFAFCLPATGFAQDNDFSRLIFEAVLLTEESGPSESPTSFAQTSGVADLLSADESDFFEDISRYRSEIERSIESGDALSGAIREQYLALGTALQRADEHEEAISVFEQAMQVDRVNGGLFSLGQLDAVQAIIESHKALGNSSEVADFREYLYYIQQKTYGPDDPGLLTATVEWADWNVESFLNGVFYSSRPGFSFSTNAGLSNSTDYIAIPNPRLGTAVYVPRNQLPNIISSPSISPLSTNDYYLRSTAYAVSPEMIIDSRIKRAQALYEEILQDDDGLSLDERISVRQKLAGTALAMKMQMDEIDRNTMRAFTPNYRFTSPRRNVPVVTRAFTRSRTELENSISELEESGSASPFQLAQAYIDLADWHLSFDRYQPGLDAYNQAWGTLAAAGTPDSDIDAFFHPVPLIALPGFALLPYKRQYFGYQEDTPLDYKGYIDLTLNIDKYGRVRSRIVIDSSSDTPAQVRSALLDYLGTYRMRPYLENGETITRSEMKIRYYYAY